MNKSKETISTQIKKKPFWKATLYLGVIVTGYSLLVAGLTKLVDDKYATPAIVEEMSKMNPSQNLPEGFETYLLITSLVSLFLIASAIAVIYGSYRLSIALLRQKPALSPKLHALLCALAFIVSGIIGTIVLLPFEKYFEPKEGMGENMLALSTEPVQLGLTILFSLVIFPALVYYFARRRVEREQKALFS